MVKNFYFGSNPFIGQEIVFYKTKPMWGMNYHGIVVADNIDSREVYDFLKKALQKVTAKHPYRGPRTFAISHWKYSCKIQGSLENFLDRRRYLTKTKRYTGYYFMAGRFLNITLK